MRALLILAILSLDGMFPAADDCKPAHSHGWGDEIGPTNSKFYEPDGKGGKRVCCIIQMWVKTCTSGKPLPCYTSTTRTENNGGSCCP